MADRLTIAAARPGQPGYGPFPTAVARVNMPDPKDPSSRIVGYRLPDNGAPPFDALCALRAFEEKASDQPTLAALLAERAPEFLAAVREWHATFASASVPRIDRALLSAIERAGLIAQEPRTTEREATIREGWWA